MTSVDLIHFIRQIPGDGLHHIAQRHQPFHGTKLIHHEGKVGARIAELFECGEQRQSFREHQRLADQRA
ncbi:hypothetical protein D3C86_1544360 [compost metagenome]